MFLQLNIYPLLRLYKNCKWKEVKIILSKRLALKKKKKMKQKNRNHVFKMNNNLNIQRPDWKSFSSSIQLNMFNVQTDKNVLFCFFVNTH